MRTTLLNMEMRGPVALLTIARPPANAINHALLREFAAVLPRLQAPQVHAVVLTGQGRFFSAGLDLFELTAYDDTEATASAAAFDDCVAGLFGLPLPLVAAVNGHAVAGGAVFAATADHRLMAEGDGQVGLTEIEVGVPFPASALEVVRYACAGPHLGELLYRGATYPPSEALARRLVDELVPADQLIERALALAADLGGRPREAFLAIKRGLRAEALSRMAAARASGQDPAWGLWRTEETQAAIAAYRARLAKGRG